MAHNGGYYHVQGQPIQPQQPPYQQVYQQPQNIYQQLGKPQPQPHLQGAPNYAVQQPHQPQQQGFQFAQPHYVPQPPQTPYQLSQTPYASPQTPYPPSQTPYMPPQTPFAQNTPFGQQQAPYQLTQTPYNAAPPPAQSPYPQPPMHQPQYAIQQQQGQQVQQQQQQQPMYSPTHTQPHATPSYPSQSPGSQMQPQIQPQWRDNTGTSPRPPPVALSATLAQQQARIQAHRQQQQQQGQIQQQQVQPQMQQQPQIQAQPQQQQPQSPQTPQTPQGQGRRPLPQPTPGANTKTPTLPPVLQRVPTLAANANANATGNAKSGPATANISSSSRFPQLSQIQTTSSTAPATPSTKSSSPTRNSRPLPTPAGTPSVATASPNLNNLNLKRATVDLVSGSSAFGSSSNSVLFSTNSNTAPNSMQRTQTQSPTKVTPPALPPRSRSSSPTKGFPSSGLPTPPVLTSTNVSTETGNINAPVSRTSSYALNSNPTPPDVPRRRASPPRFQSQPSSPVKESRGSPVKEPALWGRPAGSTASASGELPSRPALLATQQPSSTSITSTASSVNTTSTSTSEQPTKKFTPMWKRTIPEMPAPVWGYAAGMVKEPHPKAQPVPPPMHPASPTKRAQNMVAAIQAHAPPPSPTKSSGNKLKKQRSAANVSAQPPPQHPQAVAQTSATQRYSYQQPVQPPPQPVYTKTSARSGQGYTQQQQETEEETEETEEGEDEEEDETDDPRYAAPSRRPQQAAYTQNQHRRQYSQPLQDPSSSDSSRAAQPRPRSRSRPRSLHDAYAREQGYDFEVDRDDVTPKKKVLRPKAKFDPYDGYTDVSPIGLGRSTSGRRVRPKPMDDEEDTPTTSARRKRILRRDEVEVVFRKSGSEAKANGYGHERSRSAIETEMHRREGSERERHRPGSAFASPMRRRRGQDSEDEEEEYEEDDGLRLAYDESDDDEGWNGKAKGKSKAKAPVNARKGSPTKVGVGRRYEEEREREREERQSDRRRQPPPEESPQWGIRDLPPPGRRTANSSRYEDDYDAEPHRGHRGGTGLPQPPTMARDVGGVSPGAGDRKIQGGPRWKASSAPLKHDEVEEDEHERRFAGMRINEQMNQKQLYNRTDSRASTTNSVHSAASGVWPEGLPRLPRTPGSGISPGVNEAGSGRGGYFDNMRPQSGASQISSSSSRGPPSARASQYNLDIDDPPPQATVVRSPSPGPAGYTLSQRRELPQPGGAGGQGRPRPQSQAFGSFSSTSGQEAQVQRRMSLYSAPSAPLNQDMDAINHAQRRPQSQMYGSNGKGQAQTSFGHGHGQDGQHQQQNGDPHAIPRHLSSFNSSRKQQQTPAPPPTVGIESPHPVGGRDKMADIPRLEEDSTDDERRPRGVPRININFDSGSPSIPVINVDLSPSMGNASVPMINVDPPMINVENTGSPRKKPRDVDAGSGPRIQVFEVPGVSVSGPEFDDGPMINISGPDDQQHPHEHPNHHKHSHGHGQQQPRNNSQRPVPQGHSSQYGQQQQAFGAQPRRGGLLCGGCDGPIIGRIVSAMGSRWHPACFKCTVCSDLLEHVSSYEHEGRPYCHLDYHENFAPKCYTCKTAIIEEQFISLDDPALGKRTYHTQHFFCAECGDPFLDPSATLPTDANGELALSGDGEFEGFTVYKGYPYCEACHVRLRLPKCKRCKRSIRDNDEAVEALGGKWCWGCFVCASCSKPFEDPSFFQRGDQPYCEHCFSIMLRNEV